MGKMFSQGKAYNVLDSSKGEFDSKEPDLISRNSH